MNSRDNGEPQELAHDFSWLPEVLSGVPDAMRQETCERLAFAFRHHGFTVDETEALISLWNTANTNPLPDAEIREKASKAGKRYSQAERGMSFTIEKIVMIAMSPPSYRLTVKTQSGKTGVMEAPASTILSPSKFRISFLERFSEIAKLGKKWTEYLNEVLSRDLEIEEAPPDADASSSWLDACYEYLKSNAGQSKELLINGKKAVVRDNGSWLVRGSALHEYISERCGRISRNDLWKLLSGHGAKSCLVAVKNDKVESGWTTKRVWSVPDPQKEDERVGQAELNPP